MSNLLKYVLILNVTVVSLIFLSSCADDDIPITSEAEKYGVDGYVQKGPFITGSSISIAELDNGFEPNGITYESEIINNLGKYSFSKIINSSYVNIKTDGFFFNEVKGQVSPAPITLRSLSDISGSDSLNINILTTLTSKRIKYLIVNQKHQYDKAKSIAEREVLEIFGILDTTIYGFEMMNIANMQEKDAILLAISCVVQGHQTVSEISQLISEISFDIEKDGVLNNQDVLTSLVSNAINLDAESIRNNLETHFLNSGLPVSSPPFEKYIGLLVPVSVLTTSPYNTSINVPIEPSIAATFNKMLDVETVNSSTFIVSDSSGNIDGTISFHLGNRAVVFVPNGKLNFYTEYEVTLKNNIKSFDGTSLGKDYKWSFITKRVGAPILQNPYNNNTISVTSPLLQWSNVQGASSYSLQLCTDYNFQDSLILDVQNINNAHYQISTPLQGSIKYYWRVKSHTEKSYGEWSNVWNFTIKLATVDTPSPYNSQFITDTTPLLSWSHTNTAQNYHLQVSSSRDFINDIIFDIDSIPDNEYQFVTGLPDDKAYYWRVRIKNYDNIYGDWSKEWYYVIKIQIPVYLTPPNWEILTDVTPLLDWEDVSDVSNYHLQLTNNDDFQGTLIIDDSTISISEYQVIQDLPTENNFIRRLRVQNNDGVWSRWTTFWRFEIPRLDYTSNLLFFYPFNGNGNDESGNNNHSYPVNVVSAPDRFGVNNSAYKLNGNGSYIEMPNLQNLWESSWTYSIWFKLSELPTNRSDAFLFSYNEIRSNEDVHLFIDDLDNGLKTFVDGIKFTTYTVIEAGTWYRATIAYSDTQLKIYLNGNIRATLNRRFATQYPNTTKYIISSIYPDDLEKGRIYGYVDDVKFFSRALNDWEVKLLYQNQSKSN